MRSKFLLALTAGLLFCSTKQKAQVSAYSFTQTLSTYGAPSTGSLVGIPFQDEDTTHVNLPFPFVFNGVSHNTITVASNGCLSFNTLVGNEWTPISDLSTQNLISPFGDDLLMGTVIVGDIATGSNSITNISSTAGFSVGDVLFDIFGDFNSNPTITAIVGNTIVLNQNALFSTTGWEAINMSNGYIKKSISGTTPNRIFELEYGNFSRFLVYDEVLHFKVKLYETTNQIEYVYGNMTPGSGFTLPEVGLKGSTNTDFNSREVVAPITWSNSIAATTSSASCEFDNVTFPISGQSYMWTPPACTVPVLAVAPASTLICEGESLVLTASGAASYSWSNGPATAQYTVTPTATTIYTLTGANLTCTATVDYTVTVAANPTLSVAGSNTLCSGESTTLTANGATSYTWTNGPSTAQNIITPNSTTAYTLTGSNGTCTSSSIVNVTVNPSPTITISQATIACQGVGVDLIASGASSYTWANGGPNTATFSILINTSNTFTVYGSAGTCTSSATITNSFIPAPMLTPAPTPTIICAGENATFSLSGATAGLTLAWSNGASNTASTVVNSAAVPVVTVSVVANNGTCQATYSFMQNVSECTGVNEVSSDISSFITAYPNPFNSFLSLRNLNAEEVTVSILDALGKVVFTSKVKEGSDETISTESFKSGLYIISVKGSNGSFSKKLIKE